MAFNSEQLHEMINGVVDSPTMKKIPITSPEITLEMGMRCTLARPHLP